VNVTHVDSLVIQLATCCVRVTSQHQRYDCVARWECIRQETEWKWEAACVWHIMAAG